MFLIFEVIKCKKSIFQAKTNVFENNVFEAKNL